MVANHDRLTRLDLPHVAPIVGVLITINPGHFNSHVGILYRDGQSRPRILHLAFHYDLRSEEFDGSYLCADPGLEDEDAEAVAAWCRLIAQNPDALQIPFAIHCNEKAILRDVRGKPVISPPGEGLNCSTFVLAVFRSSSINLVNYYSWQMRNTDIPWQKKVVSFLKDRVSSDYLDSVTRNIGCPRVRPEEVAGACLEDRLPADFQQCTVNGTFVLKQVSMHTGRKSKW